MASRSKTVPFHLVDVFAVEPLSGNPLAVVDGGANLSLDLLQRIAREFNQSETTFVLPPTLDGADWRLRSFTSSGAEVFGAGGHNTLGAWWWLAQAGKLPLEGNETTFHQEIGNRVLPLTIAKHGGRLANVVMNQDAPAPRKLLRDFPALAKALGLTVDDLATDLVPTQVVFTGAPHLMVPVKNREAVDRIQPDAPELFKLLHSVEGEGCYVFSLDPYQPEAFAYARFFNPTVGIWEDPATGTAAGPLAAHLANNGVINHGQAIIIEQGTKLGRTSLIKVEAFANTVKVSGRGVIVASGELFL